MTPAQRKRLQRARQRQAQKAAIEVRLASDVVVELHALMAHAGRGRDETIELAISEKYRRVLGRQKQGA